MPTNRPFLANLFVAFRAHSAIQKPSSSSSSSSSSAKPPTVTSTTQKASVTTAASSSSASATPSSTSSQATQAINTPSSQQQQQQHARRRRSSSNSSMEAVGGTGNAFSSGEKWWIGGRASDGQAKFYQLQPVYVDLLPKSFSNDTVLFKSGPRGFLETFKSVILASSSIEC